MPSVPELLAWIDAFRPTAAEEWRVLDGYVQALPDELDVDAVPPLLGVFARFPRHDGHGVFWVILHTVEAITGYAPLLVAHVQRTPTEMGVTMLRRLVAAGTTQVGTVALAPLIAEAARRAPIVDYTIDAAQRAPAGTTYPQLAVDSAPSTLAAQGAPPRIDGAPAGAPPEAARVARRDVSMILADLAAFAPPPADDVDWAPLLALLAELEATPAPLDQTIDTLLATLDRFRTYTGFGAFWRIVGAIEGTPGYAAALVASVQRAPTASGVTLLLRALANGITRAGDVELAPLAASLLPAPPAHAH